MVEHRPRANIERFSHTFQFQTAFVTKKSYAARSFQIGHFSCSVQSVALHPLRLAFRFSIGHKIILDALFPISTPHAEFLQDCTIIQEDRLTALYSGVSIIKLKHPEIKNTY
jgi:hypothetical protein